MSDTKIKIIMAVCFLATAIGFTLMGYVSGRDDGFRAAQKEAPKASYDSKTDSWQYENNPLFNYLETMPLGTERKLWRGDPTKEPTNCVIIKRIQ